jgi:hypothetical protein
MSAEPALTLWDNGPDMYNLVLDVIISSGADLDVNDRFYLAGTLLNFLRHYTHPNLTRLRAQKGTS